jgi:hypothetical protein
VPRYSFSVRHPAPSDKPSAILEQCRRGQREEIALLPQNETALVFRRVGHCSKMAAPVDEGGPWSDSERTLVAASSEPMSRRPAVKMLTQTSNGRDQIVLGKVSASSSEIEEFCGIPYGTVPRRWEHSLLRTSLPADVFDASCHG